MAEKLNNSVASETEEAVALPVVSSDTQIQGNDNTESVLESELLDFNRRYEEIEKLCSKVAEIHTASVPHSDSEEQSTPRVKCADVEDGIVLEITLPVSDAESKASQNSGAVLENFKTDKESKPNLQSENPLGDEDFWNQEPESSDFTQEPYESEGPDAYEEEGSDTVSLYLKGELLKRINSFHKEQSSLQRRILKIEERQSEVDLEGRISLIVEKIGVQKELCELTIEMLGSCVYIDAKGKISRYKRVLKSHIDRYNIYCEEYESTTGRPLGRLDYGMIDDTVSGKICRPIPTVYYYGAEDDATYNPYDESDDRRRRYDEDRDLIEGEFKRYLDGASPLYLTDAERRALEKRNAEKMSAIKRAAERDVLLVGLRSEYNLELLESKRDLLVRSYGLDKRKTLKVIRDIEKKIEKINKNAKLAVREQREENSRFYLLKALDPANENLRAGARRERLDALRARLDILLAERESVNDRLIALYGGSDNNLKRAKVVRKAAKVRRKSATSMYKKQRRLAKKIDKYRVPAEMKELAYGLLNKKTQAVATADECHYKLKRLRPEGRAKRELVREIRRSKRAVRNLDREIRYMLRKLRRTEERYEDAKEIMSVIAFCAVVVVLGVFVWLTFGDSITAYFSKLISQLRGG